MKLADKTVEVHSRGLSSSNQFTIQQSSKMFKLLSDSLYSDKVQAVIRELSTNAYDAHIAAGNQNPFKVILPTQAAPSFTVRDYGTGLSQKDMEELYTTYGASNKNDSNDFVGCLGLGSKSPFAYTKSFSTASYYNGSKYSYIAAMDESGVPSLNLFNISPTTEPNGLEISFAVKNYDFGEFTHKAKRIFHYFKMKPIIEGGTDTNLSDHSYSHHNCVIQGTGWKIGRVSSDNTQYPSQWHSPGSSVIAIMGNIAYPVDADKIIGEEKEQTNDSILRWNRVLKKADLDNWKNLVREILRSGLYLEIQFSIGELEMDVSREGLQYTKNVIKVLRDRTQDIYLQLKEDMSKKLEECSTLTDAYITYYNLSDLAGGWTAGASWTDPDGKVHELQSCKDLEYKFQKNKQLYVFNFRTSGYRSRRMVYLTDKIHYQTLQSVPEYHWSGPKKNGKMIFFRCDVKGAETAKKIVTKYCNQNDCYAYLMIDSDNPEDSTQGFDNLIKDIGGESNVVNVSEYRSLLSNGTRKSGTKYGQISNDEIFILSKSPDAYNTKILLGRELNDSFSLRELSQEVMEGLEENTIVYFPIVRYSSPENYPNISSINDIMGDKNHLLHRLFNSQNIFAVKQSSIDKLKKQGYDLVDLNDWLKPQLETMVQKLSDKVSYYGSIVEYCKNQYNIEEKSDNYAYYRSPKTDQKIITELLNLFGINYEKYIGNTELCNQIDNWMIYNFFAEIMHNNFGINFCTKEEYYTVMTKILDKYNLNGIDPEKIKKYHSDFTELKHTIGELYDEEYMSALKLKQKKNQDFFKSIPTMVQLRKNLKDEVDKVPMLKYIVCSVVEGGSSSINQILKNPLKLHHNSYYSVPEWYSTLGGNDKFEEIRTVLGGMVK
jgi:hypothetical protein